MLTETNVLSIAAHDPTGGAGLLSDVKTFAHFGVPGMGISTGITFQDEDTMTGVEWLPKEVLLNQIRSLLPRYSFPVVKIGMIENMDVLASVLAELVGMNSKSTIIWDPVLASSSGFKIHGDVDQKKLIQVLKLIDCITPNLDEVEQLSAWSKLELLQFPCPWIALKGGHSEGNLVIDRLYENGLEVCAIEANRLNKSIHGSGCIFSASMAASLWSGDEKKVAFRKAHDYVRQMLMKTNSRLAPQHIDL